MCARAERGEVRPLKSRRVGCTCSDGDNTRAGYAVAMLCLASCRQLDVMVSYFSHEGPDVGAGSMLMVLAGSISLSVYAGTFARGGTLLHQFRDADMVESRWMQ